MAREQVVYRVSGSDKAVKRAVAALQVVNQSGGKVVRTYADQKFAPPEPLPTDADVIIIVTETTTS